MPVAKPGEVWLTDLGMQAKVRPCLILLKFIVGNLPVLILAPVIILKQKINTSLNRRVQNNSMIGCVP